MARRSQHQSIPSTGYTLIMRKMEPFAFRSTSAVSSYILACRPKSGHYMSSKKLHIKGTHENNRNSLTSYLLINVKNGVRRSFNILVLSSFKSYDTLFLPTPVHSLISPLARLCMFFPAFRLHSLPPPDHKLGYVAAPD
jgi:hypothetical protein